MRLWFAHKSGVALCEQLVTQIILGILSGELAPEQRLPRTRELARRFRLHPNTVSRAAACGGMAKMISRKERFCSHWLLFTFPARCKTRVEKSLGSQEFRERLPIMTLPTCAKVIVLALGETVVVEDD